MGRPPRDLDTEGTYVPPSRVRLPSAEVSTSNRDKQAGPQKEWAQLLARSADRDRPTNTHCITLRTSTQTTARTPKRARAVSGGGLRGGSRAQLPPPSNRCIDLRFVIRIANRKGTTSGSQPSRDVSHFPHERIPFVPETFCPIYVE